jgi:hypothetical protein
MIPHSTWRACQTRASCSQMSHALPPRTRAARSKAPTRSSSWFALPVLALGCVISNTAPAQASDPGTFISEIITPAGWEIRPASPKRCTTWVSDTVTDAELVTPEGWGDTRTPQPSWSSGGCMCSELVVPEAWVRALTPKQD